MMTEQEKELLLKDLCARLPYGVIVRYVCPSELPNDEREFKMTISETSAMRLSYVLRNMHTGHFKYYLRPMSSMTEEELNECVCQSGIKDIECPNWQDIPKEKQFEARLNHAIAVFLTDSNNVDWLNAHHFDHRGLIEMGLALEASEDMYNI